MIAWKLLRERYDTNKLINHHIDALSELPLMATDSPSALYQLVDDFSNHAKSLKSLGEPKGWDGLFIHLLEIKLHPRACGNGA